MSTGPQRISILSPTLSRGGTTRAYWLAQVAAEAGLAAEVIGSLRPAETLYPEPPSDVRLRLVPWSRRGGVVPRLLEALDGDIIWAVKPRPASYGIALLKRLKTRVPVVLDIDDLERAFIGIRDFSGSPDAPPAVRARRRLLACRSPDFGPWVRVTEKLTPLADAITVNSSDLQVRFGGIYLPSGKDTRRFDPAAHDAEQCKLRLGLAGYRCVMFPGTPAPHKGIEDVVEALELLGDETIRLVVVGGRRGGQRYLSGLGPRAQKWIIHLPQMAVDEMPAVVAAADVIVVAQRDADVSHAQTPMKLTDGMAMAKPIVATRVGDLPTILGGVAALTDPSDIGGLARAIERTLADGAYARKLGQAARVRCVADFSLPAAASSLRKVLQDLANGEHGRLAPAPVRAP